MKSNTFFKKGRILVVIMLLISPIALMAQTPTNFSGKWQYEKAKSVVDKLEPDFDGIIILEITQNAATISFAEVYKREGSADWKTAVESYKLDGKEQITKHDVGTNKYSARWSADKKVLTITNTDTQNLKGVLQDFIVIDTYSLSADGKTLTIERYRKNPVTGETKAKKVYAKK